MDAPSNIADSLDQADEDILIPTVSDDALEAAAGGYVTETPNSDYCRSGFLGSHRLPSGNCCEFW
jgi:hypothetical protein